KCRRAFVQRDAKRSAFPLHFKNASCSQFLIERTIWKGDRHTLRFGQSLGLHGLRAGDQTNRIDFPPVELPFFRVQEQQQTIWVPHERYPKARGRTSHGAVVELIGLISRRDMPRTNSDYLTILRLLSECRRDEWDHTNECNTRSHRSLHLR